jgi:flavin-dependent thymidylate synthase
MYWLNIVKILADSSNGDNMDLTPADGMINHKNSVELIGYYGSDEIHACSAWTSTSRDLSPGKLERVPQLLKKLAADGHHTPFEKSALHFLVDTDIASHIHILKHRIGVPVNGESARYKEIKEDKYYIPKDWEGIGTNICALDAFADATWAEALERYTKIGNRLYHDCVKDLTPILGRKRAKESARFFKTYNSQIQADVMFNWRSFNHFLSLRMKDDAQDEIHEIAKEMLKLVKEIPGEPFKHTIEAFGYGIIEPNGIGQ